MCHPQVEILDAKTREQLCFLDKVWKADLYILNNIINRRREKYIFRLLKNTSNKSFTQVDPYSTIGDIKSQFHKVCEY